MVACRSASLFRLELPVLSFTIVYHMNLLIRDADAKRRCCTMVGLVENALLEIRDKYAPDRIIIESR